MDAVTKLVCGCQYAGAQRIVRCPKHEALDEEDLACWQVDNTGRIPRSQEVGNRTKGGQSIRQRVARFAE